MPEMSKQLKEARLASPVYRYGMAVGLVALAFLATLLVQRLFQYPFLFFFFAAVMVGAWMGGTGAGLLAVLISTLLVDYFFLPPLYTFAIAAADVGYFAAFVICAFVASWISASKRRTEKALLEARDQLELRVAERTADLEKTIAELHEKEGQRLALQDEKSELSERLESRKAVERAKGILQRELKISEEEAYRRLQRESQDRRKSMKEIAESVILNDELKRGSR